MLSVRLDRYDGRLRRRPGRSPTSRLDTGYRTPHSGESPQSPGRGRPPLFPPSPSQRSAPLTPTSSSRLNSRLCTASMAFTLKDGLGSPLIPLHTGTFTTRRFARRRGLLSRSPLQGLSTLHFDAGRFPPTPAVRHRAPWRLPGPGSTPAGNDELPTESDHVITQPLSNCRAYSRVPLNFGGGPVSIRLRSPRHSCTTGSANSRSSAARSADCRPAPTAITSRPARTPSAILGHRHPDPLWDRGRARVHRWIWLLFFTAVPLLLVASRRTPDTYHTAGLERGTATSSSTRPCRTSPNPGASRQNQNTRR